MDDLTDAQIEATAAANASATSGTRRTKMREQPFLLASGPWVEVRDGNLTAAALYDRHAPGLAGRGREQPREVGLPRTAHGAVSHWSQEVNALNAIPVIGWVIAQGSAKRGEEQWPL